jgi:hypothetical protein
VRKRWRVRTSNGSSPRTRPTQASRKRSLRSVPDLASKPDQPQHSSPEERRGVSSRRRWVSARRHHPHRDVLDAADPLLRLPARPRARSARPRGTRQGDPTPLTIEVTAGPGRRDPVHHRPVPTRRAREGGGGVTTHRPQSGAWTPSCRPLTVDAYCEGQGDQKERLQPNRLQPITATTTAIGSHTQ